MAETQGDPLRAHYEGRLCLVTGGAGFVGSSLCHRLVALGARVRVFDDFSTGSVANLAGVRGSIEILRGDVRDYPALLAASQGVSLVFHQAAVASVPQSLERTLETAAVNGGGTLNALEAAASQGVQRLVFASSASIYGDAHEGSIGEDTPLDPRSPYAASKASGELMCRAFAHSKGLETACLRYFNIFGPRQDPRSQYAGVIPIFIDALHGRHPLTIFGDGLQTRDFTFVEDIVQANLLAGITPDAVGRPMNIGSGRSVTILGLAERLAEVAGIPLELDLQPARGGDVRYSTADISLAKGILGYAPQVDFEAGLAQTFAWFESR